MILLTLISGIIAMDTDALVIGLVGLILGGGGVGAVIPVIRYRTDKDSAIAVGAESAVQSLTAALAISDQRVTKLETEMAKKDTVIERLMAKVEELERIVRNQQ